MRHLQRLLVGLAFLALVLANLDGIAAQSTLVAPPGLDGLPPIEAETARTSPDGRVRLGPCWTGRHRGQRVFYAKGDAFTLGYCNSHLLGDVMVRQEAELQATLDRFLPFGPLQRAVLRTVTYVYRHLPEYLSSAITDEIHGYARGYAADPGSNMAPAFSRILYYHAIHDISQAMVDNPILACSAFAGSGAATADGHTLLGRVFDFEGGRVFDEDKVVLFYEPDYGLPFVSVLWAGMAGAVSGMNAAGIAAVLNAAASDDGAVRGTPTTVVLREILQYATSVDDAISLLRRRRVFVTDILTLADGKTGEVAVVELTPERVVVRERSDLVVATNHLLGAAFSEDEENAGRVRHGTTQSRLTRLEELVSGARGALSPALAQEILRDRKRPGGEPAGLGHRGTIDALIAAHAVIFDATALRIWVSRAPHTLGEFVAYDLREVLGGELRDHGALPADALLADGGWARYQEARALLDHASDLEPAAAIERIRQANAPVPGHPPGLTALAEACEEAGDREGAVEAWRAFLDAAPPHRSAAEEATERLEALEGGD